jgi:serine/threonine-protein kinase
LELKPGQELLHYRLVERIGEGGMGVVWRAVDTSLDRQVAIKILPDRFAVDEERLARFEREARVLASLNHPHVAGIHGIHESDGIRFLSMELVPGEDLSDEIARGPLPLRRALEIARQIAEGLEAAHENGIVHRDLKPANVRLTPDGKAKVLDFGLAKAYDPAAASDPQESQTLTSAGTVAGLILGTAAYMSPEQASGQPTDRRCDVWSFGVVLFEMLSGKRLFAGETVSHTLADVLRSPLDLDALPAEVPRKVRRLIERCLTRDRMRRLRDIGEARITIEDVLAGPDSEEAGAETETASRPSGRVPWIVAVAGFVLAVGALGWGLSNRTEGPRSEPVRRFALEVASGGNTRQGDGMAIAISPDGTRVVTRGGSGAEDALYVRALDDFEPRRVEGTTNAINPVFSPDGEWIVFVSTSGMRKVRSTGGPASEVTEFKALPSGLDWGQDGYVYYGHQGSILRAPSDGGPSEVVVAKGDSDGRGYHQPRLLPGADALLCCSLAAPGVPGELFVADLATQEIRSLGVAGTDPRWLPTGHILFAESDRVMVAPFDLDRLELTGAPEPVLPRVWIDQGQMQLDVAGDGTVAYLPNAGDRNQRLVTVGLNGDVDALLGEPLPFRTVSDPRYSPDGRRVIVTVDTGAVWMIDLDMQTTTLVSESGFYPQWSPDGEMLLFGSGRNETFDIYRRPADLSIEDELLLDVENNLRTADWTRQGPVIIREEIPGKGMDLRLWSDLDDPSSLTPLLEGPDDELAPDVSPDGKWLAYVSEYSGADEVYVTPFPDAGSRYKISNGGGHSPVWSPDGRTLYYISGLSMIAATVETDPRFTVTSRETLFEGRYVQYRWSRQYDMHPDGTRFVLIENPLRGNVEVITRWFDELTR